MIEQLVVPKQQLSYLTEADNCASALDLLEDQGLRCVPVLDATQTLYRGNLYRYHIYQYAYHHPDEDLSRLPVTHFLKNTTRVVHEQDSFYHLVFTLNDLPYVAVLDRDNRFSGIIRHNTMLQWLAQAWAMPNAGFALLVETLGSRGELAQVSKLINRFSDIVSATTLEKTDMDTKGQILYALPSSLDPVEYNQLVKQLERRGYRIRSYRLH